MRRDLQAVLDLLLLTLLAAVGAAWLSAGRQIALSRLISYLKRAVFVVETGENRTRNKAVCGGR